MATPAKLIGNLTYALHRILTQIAWTRVISLNHSTLYNKPSYNKPSSSR